MTKPRAVSLLSFLLLFFPLTGRCAVPDFSWRRVQQAGVLRWGADPDGGAPFVYFDKNDTRRAVGFEVDLMDVLARRLGLKAKMIRAEWAFLVDDLLAGHSDIIVNGLEIKEERRKKLAFSEPYYIYRQQLTVRDADKDRYATLEDLKGRPIATLKGAEANNVLKSAGWTDALLDQMTDSQTPYTELKLKKVDAVLQEDVITSYYAPLFPGLAMEPKTFAPGRYGIASRKEDQELLAHVGAALESMKKDGSLAAIYRKWGIWSPIQARIGIRPAAKTGPPQEAAAEGGAPIKEGSVFLQLLAGAGYTFALTAISMPLAVAVGLVIALMRMARSRWLSAPATAYVEIVRGTPLIVQVFLVYFSLPVLGQALGTELLTWPRFFVGVFCLSLNYAAYEAEIHRAGLEAIDKGQREAALSLGLDERRSFRLVILPQALRVITPPVINDLISMLKDSSIVSVIGVGELLCTAQALGRSSATSPQMLALAALFYLGLSLACSVLGKALEKRLKTTGSNELHMEQVHGH